MYGTCETLCRELAVKYPVGMPRMLVIWRPGEIQALADGMRDPRPLSREELERVAAHAALVVSRTFPDQPDSSSSEPVL